MEETPPDEVPLRSGPKFGILTALSVVGFVTLVWVEKEAPTADLRFSMSEAAAGLMAATLAVVVSHLSHHQGRMRRTVMAERGEAALGHRRVKIEGVLMVCASVVLLVVAILVADHLEMSVAATAALVAAVLSYALADFLHNTSSMVRTHPEWGWGLVVIVLVVAVVWSGLAPSVAEAVAAIAAAGVTFGGSLVGHGEGASL